MVCDSAQAIYGWRSARDVMTGFDGHALSLSQSFRFGPRLADEANRWLAIADAPIRLTGTDAIPTELAPVDRSDAVLCRTNIGAMTEVMAHLGAGYRVGLAGGGESLRSLATAVRDLKEGRRTGHPELILFPSWGAGYGTCQRAVLGRRGGGGPASSSAGTHAPDPGNEASLELENDLVSLGLADFADRVVNSARVGVAKKLLSFRS